jgi:hypothetical protein
MGDHEMGGLRGKYCLVLAFSFVLFPRFIIMHCVKFLSF